MDDRGARPDERSASSASSPASPGWRIVEFVGTIPVRAAFTISGWMSSPPLDAFLDDSRRQAENLNRVGNILRDDRSSADDDPLPNVTRSMMIAPVATNYASPTRQSPDTTAPGEIVRSRRARCGGHEYAPVEEDVASHGRLRADADPAPTIGALP